MKKFLLKSLFALICVFSLNLSVSANQNQLISNSPEPNNTGKWYFGGNIGLNFWSDYFLISVEPIIGYHVSSKFSLGIKPHYSYIKENNDNIEDFTYHNFGGSVFARYSPVPLGYLHAEFAYNNYEQYSYNSISQDYESERVWVPFLLLGAGYRQPLGPNVTAYAEVLFDVIQDKNSPFKKWEPIVHAGVAFGF
jgi:hypothetical protein